ncbi:MAG: DUF2726 domain-containing protein [Burkholderiales bacterium]|nr:DUF2726 domain-containing protein [Burkholderiales bacterium]
MDSSTTWIVAGIVLLIALAAAWLWQRRRPAAAPAQASHERFAAAAAISPAQTELLQYLVDAFAGRPVLFRVPLSQLVTPRGAGDRLQTQRRLAEHSVDFVVCDRAGRAMYAFELDAVHDNDEQAEQDAAEKHRVLKAAGIRLIRVKRSTRGMPSPHEFRQRLRTASLTPPAAAASGQAPLGQAPTAPSAAAPTPAPAAKNTEPMSLTDLMDLAPATTADDDPWGSERRR